MLLVKDGNNEKDYNIAIEYLLNLLYKCINLIFNIYIYEICHIDELSINEHSIVR